MREREAVLAIFTIFSLNNVFINMLVCFRFKFKGCNFFAKMIDFD